LKKYWKLRPWSDFRGFTLMEIVLVIVVLGILAAVAVPRFFDFSETGKQEAETVVVQLVRTGINDYYNRAVTRGTTPLYPAALDAASNGSASASNPFFGNVLTQPETDNWTKNGTTYTGPAGGSYTYNSSTGSFQ
jgi:prepilin-type N-terminal cleavage/methylation domain-containing protein